MQLLILFGNEVIDSIEIDGSKLHMPGYVAYFQEELINRNEEALEISTDSPQFAIEYVPSRNAFESLLTVQHKYQL